MSRPQDLLEKRLKFKVLHKYVNSPRDQPALSLPENPYSPTYVNAALAKKFLANSVRRVYVSTDAEEEAIALAPTTDTAGFRLIASRQSGMCLTAKLRGLMPHGRYVFVVEESDENLLVFRKEHVTFKKGIQDGPIQTDAH